MSNLARAIQMASTEFVNDTDKGGNPYILHCLWVMNKVRHLGVSYMIVAVLHDILEDIEWMKSDYLRKEGFSEEIVQAIILLTREKYQPYDEYIEGILSNDLATQVKLRDLEHNSKITRLKGVSEKDLRRMRKYHKAYTILKAKRR